MKVAKSLGLVVLGVVIGAVSVRTVGGQSQARQPGPRISAIAAENGFQFVKDAKSGGCWIFFQSMVEGRPAVSAMAAAPQEACAELQH
jgi:hypothetical protein